MTLAKIPTDSRSRSYSDRVIFNENKSKFLRIAEYLGELKREDWALISKPGSVKLTTVERKDLLVKRAGAVYARGIIQDNDSLLSLSWRTLKANRREWHRDLQSLNNKKKLSPSEARKKERVESLLATLIRPSVCLGGRSLWKQAQTDAGKMSDFKLKRHWCGGIGISDYVSKDTGETVNRYQSNQVIRLDEEGNLLVNTPVPLRSELEVDARGGWLNIGTVRFNHGQDVIDANRENGRSITYHIQYTDGHWKLRAQTRLETVVKQKSKRVLGIDLNAGHLDACILDEYGNPVGRPRTVKYSLKKINDAVSKTLAWAADRGVTAVIIEDLTNLQRTTTRGGKRGALNKTISNIPSGQFKGFLNTSCEDRGWVLEIVDPSYTSKNGPEWTDVLKNSGSNHQVASYLIGRRGLGYTIDRKKTVRRLRLDSGLNEVDLWSASGSIPGLGIDSSEDENSESYF